RSTVFVRDAAACPRTPLSAALEPARARDGLGNESHPPLALGGLLRYPDSHRPTISHVCYGLRLQPPSEGVEVVLEPELVEELPGRLAARRDQPVLVARPEIEVGRPDV